MGSRRRFAAWLLAALALAGCGSQAGSGPRSPIDRNEVCKKYNLTSPSVRIEVGAWPGAGLPYHNNQERAERPIAVTSVNVRCRTELVSPVKGPYPLSRQMWREEYRTQEGGLVDGSRILTPDYIHWVEMQPLVLSQRWYLIPGQAFQCRINATPGDPEGDPEFLCLVTVSSVFQVLEYEGEAYEFSGEATIPVKPVKLAFRGSHKKAAAEGSKLVTELELPHRLNRAERTLWSVLLAKEAVYLLDGVADACYGTASNCLRARVRQSITETIVFEPAAGTWKQVVGYLLRLAKQTGAAPGQVVPPPEPDLTPHAHDRRVASEAPRRFYTGPDHYEKVVIKWSKTHAYLTREDSLAGVSLGGFAHALLQGGGSHSHEARREEETTSRALLDYTPPKDGVTRCYQVFLVGGTTPISGLVLAQHRKEADGTCTATRHPPVEP